MKNGKWKGENERTKTQDISRKVWGKDRVRKCRALWKLRLRKYRSPFSEGYISSENKNARDRFGEETKEKVRFE